MAGAAAHSSQPAPLVVAHRGASLTHPENTVAAFLAARDAGADAVEMDVQCSRDGCAVIMHDYFLDRTTDGSGLVWDHDAAAIARLDAGSWWGTAWAGERVPTLADVLAIEGLMFELEVKVPSRDFVDVVVAAVERAGV